jgi:hypothetical protein
VSRLTVLSQLSCDEKSAGGGKVARMSRLRLSESSAAPTAGSAPATPAAGPSSWLTVVLRPAGELGPREAGRLARALVRAAVSADAVILDLRAVRGMPDAVRHGVDDASALLARRGDALLVLDQDGEHDLGGEAVELGDNLLAPPD